MTRNALPHAQKPRRLRGLAGLAVSALAASSLVATALPASAAIATTSNATTLAAAITGPGANVTGASFATVPGGTPHAVSTTPLAGSPTNGADFAILTTGNAALADAPNSAGNTGVDLLGPHVRGNTDQDVSVLKIDLNVQPTANCLSFDFKFLSEEYPEWVGTQYNDAFIAEMDTSTWTTSGSSIIAPDNFAFDANNNVVSVNAVGLGGFSPANSVGTTYDGATPQLSAAKQVNPGAHSLYLSIFDQGDGIYDSAVFVDNLRVGWVPDPATQCRPGAVVKNFQLDLTPATATKDLGTSHTVTATLKDLGQTPAELVQGGTILFTASGVNSASGSDVTDSNGEATFAYSGTTAGVDAISACYDVDNSGTCDAQEVIASAQVTWVNPPPTNDAGGPYSGKEGSAVSITGTADDPNDDPLTHTWTYAAVAGVDAGATCTFGDASALSTTVTCTDDGTYELTLSTSDAVNPAVTDTATLILANVAPVIGSVTTPVDPVAVGTSVQLSGTYTDAGSNDTHTASIDWGDGTSTPPASAGAVTGSHTYASAGIYTVCLTVTDDDGGSDRECSANYIVVYDPAAGFVTGGGWITAPAGSYPADPSASGPGRFGFVSKYQKGATTPVGNTEFQFQSGDLNFHSSSYDWLVIAGAKAIYKGTGTVNGDAGYKFLVSAIDGAQPGGGGADKFRIKIWAASTDVVVFDNQIGAANDAAASTAITKGSIVIHN